jgi:hypothetical protein
MNIQNLINQEVEKVEKANNIDYSHLNDSNQEFVEFKENIKVWLKMDDDIKTLQNALKDIKKKKEEMTPKILSFMKNNELKHLDTNDGKIQYKSSFVSKPINKKMIINRLGDYFKDFEKGANAAAFILENREKEEKVRLTRSVRKKKESLDI